MAVSEHRNRVLSKLRRSRRDYTKREAADMLAPLEEKSPARNNGGAIVVGTEDLKIPKGLLEEQGREESPFRLEPVVIVILLIALAFIAFIAHLISIEPR